MAPSAYAGVAAVILAGGTGRRLGNIDKAALVVGGRTLLERAAAAVADASPIIVVGPQPAGTRHPIGTTVRFAREDPPRGGPAAGLLAGRDAVGGREELEELIVLAVDMPGVTRDSIERLLLVQRAAAPDGTDGAFLHGPDGRRQLAGVLRVQALDRVRAQFATETGLPMHRLLGGLNLVEVAASAEESADIDTWTDLQRHG